MLICSKYIIHCQTCHSPPTVSQSQECDDTILLHTVYSLSSRNEWTGGWWRRGAVSPPGRRGARCRVPSPSECTLGLMFSYHKTNSRVSQVSPVRHCTANTIELPSNSNHICCPFKWQHYPDSLNQATDIVCSWFYWKLNNLFCQPVLFVWDNLVIRQSVRKHLRLQNRITAQLSLSPDRDHSALPTHMETALPQILLDPHGSQLMLSLTGLGWAGIRSFITGETCWMKGKQIIFQSCL